MSVQIPKSQSGLPPGTKMAGDPEKHPECSRQKQPGRPQKKQGGWPLISCTDHVREWLSLSGPLICEGTKDPVEVVGGDWGVEGFAPCNKRIAG